MKMLTYVALVGQASAIKEKSKCPFGFTSGTKPGAVELAQVEEGASGEVTRYPSQMFTCPTKAIMKTDVDHFGDDQYAAVVKDILAQYEEHMKEKTPAGEVSKGARMAGSLLRFAGHDLMDYRVHDKVNTGGSDGCMDFSTGDNAGLENGMRNGKIPEAYEKHCGYISLADFTVIAAEAVMGRTSPTYNKENPFAEGTLLNTFRENFLAGRETTLECPWSVDRMPNPENGEDAMREVFVENVFNAAKDGWRMTTAIIGAHTLGGASLENSGYEGTWSDPEDQGKFNNGYYRNLLLKGWGTELGVNGNPNKNQWIRVDRGAPSQKQMMLNTDMAMVFKQNNAMADCMKKAEAVGGTDKRAVKRALMKATAECRNKWSGRSTRDTLPGIKAQNGECCAWISAGCLNAKGAINKRDLPHDYCGYDPKKYLRAGKLEKACCGHIGANSFGDCDNSDGPQGHGYKIMAGYVADEAHWLQDFSSAWKLATTNGHSGLRYLDQTKSDPEPVFDECSAITNGRKCNRESEGHCMWKAGAKSVTGKGGRTWQRSGCVPFEREF